MMLPWPKSIVREGCVIKRTHPERGRVRLLCDDVYQQHLVGGVRMMIIGLMAGV